METHQRWDAVRYKDGRAELRLADERALVPGDVVTLVPPRDVHNHGHVDGTGPSPYSLILLGDDMLLFDREEYDPEQGAWQALALGDPGRPTAESPRSPFVQIGFTSSWGMPLPCAEAILGWWLRHLWCARARVPERTRLRGGHDCDG